MGWPDKQMDGEKDRRTLPHVLSPCYAVDKYVVNMVITLQLLMLGSTVTILMILLYSCMSGCQIPGAKNLDFFKIDLCKFYVQYDKNG